MWNWTNYDISLFLLLKLYGKRHHSAVPWTPRNLGKMFLDTDHWELEINFSYNNIQGIIWQKNSGCFEPWQLKREWKEKNLNLKSRLII